MEIQKNSRQMPKKEEYTSNKAYSDIVYGWLQVHSEWDREQGIRWIDKKTVNYSAMADQLGLTRQTVSTKFKRLLDKDDKGKAGLGLVVFNAELKRYELIQLSADMATLIENGTLRMMISALNENTINIYIYLLNRFLANREQPFEFTLDQCKTFIGKGVGSHSNNYIITDILCILAKLDLVQYELVQKADGSNVKTVYRVTSVNNKIEC